MDAEMCASIRTMVKELNTDEQQTDETMGNTTSHTREQTEHDNAVLTGVDVTMECGIRAGISRITGRSGCLDYLHHGYLTSTERIEDFKPQLISTMQAWTCDFVCDFKQPQLYS